MATANLTPLPQPSADALRRCLRVLAPLYDAAALARMAGVVETCVQRGRWPAHFFVKDVATLFYPADPERAERFLRQMDEAMDSGDLGRARGRRTVSRSHLTAWPACPPVPVDSPLIEWLPAWMREQPASVEAEKKPRAGEGESRWWVIGYDVDQLAREFEQQMQARDYGTNHRGRRQGRVPLTKVAEEVARRIISTEKQHGRSRAIGGKTIENYLREEAGWT